MVEIRHAGVHDAECINEIGNHYILNSPANFKTEILTLAERVDWIRGFKETGRYQLFVSLEDGKVTGYAGSSRFHERNAYETSVTTSIYLHPTACGKGWGTLLYARLFEALAAADLNRAFACITLPNPGSEALHKKFGFSNIGIFSQAGRKSGQFWDVLWMEKIL